MRSILITGGTGGLGTAVVTRLARDYRCVVLYHGEASWQALRRDVEVEGIAADLTDETALARAVGGVGELYGVVHLVGGFATGGVASRGSVWSKMLSLNLITAVNVIRAALPQLVDGGRIVAISSLATVAKPAGIAPYVVSKSALNALIEALAVEVKDRRITANALLPDALGTPAMRASAGSTPLVPIEHVAETIAWLLSDAASELTGALIPLRGGS
jgi:NAD(P)-dependent dehydrogenase (short-subunit alcohol dehydrogenase family)